jgi:hypothetical protein
VTEDTPRQRSPATEASAALTWRRSRTYTVATELPSQRNSSLLHMSLHAAMIHEYSHRVRKLTYCKTISRCHSDIRGLLRARSVSATIRHVAAAVPHLPRTGACCIHRDHQSLKFHRDIPDFCVDLWEQKYASLTEIFLQGIYHRICDTGVQYEPNLILNHVLNHWKPEHGARMGQGAHGRQLSFD